MITKTRRTLRHGKREDAPTELLGLYDGGSRGTGQNRYGAGTGSNGSRQRLCADLRPLYG